MRSFILCLSTLVFFISCSKPIILTAQQDVCINKTEITGEGTQESPYIMCSSKHLKLLDDYLSDTDVNIRSLYDSAYYKQTANITLDPVDTVDFPIGNSTYQFTNRSGAAAIMGELTNITYSFDGIYDGQNYSIKSFSYSAANQEDILGLFDTLGANSIIKNLKLVDFDLTLDASLLAGGLAAVSAGVIENVRVENISISGDGIIVGGLLGFTVNSVKKIKVSGQVDGSDTVGGVLAVLGAPVEIELSNIENSSDVTSDGGPAGGVAAIMVGKIVGTNIFNSGKISSNDKAAGIAGSVYSGSLYGYGAGTDPVFTNISNSGDINSTADGAGVFVDFYLGSVTQVKNTGNVNGDDYASGLFGTLNNSSVSEVSNTGNIISKKSSVGIVMDGETFSLSKCSSTGNITVTNDYTAQWGDAAGILGAIYDGGGIVTIDNCYVTGTITTPINVSDAAPLVADLWHFDGSLTITNTYSAMSIVGGRNYRGGIVGTYTPDIDPTAIVSLDDSVYYIQSPDRDGPFGSDARPVGFVSTAVEIQAADLSSAANFPEFDFTNIWVMRNGHPELL